MGITRPASILAPERIAVKRLLAAPPLVRCARCGHVSAPGDEVSPGGGDIVMGWTQPSCDYPDRCARQRRGLSRTEPARIAVQAERLRCACCERPFGDGIQRVRVVGGRITCWSHALCTPQCQVRRTAATS